MFSFIDLIFLITDIEGKANQAKSNVLYAIVFQCSHLLKTVKIFCWQTFNVLFNLWPELRDPGLSLWGWERI